MGTGASNSTLSANITINSLDMTGYTNTLTQPQNVNLTIAGSGVVFKLSSGMTYTVGGTITAITFTGTSGTTLITTAGKTLGCLIFNGPGGTFQLQDNATSTGVYFTVTNGTFDPNGKSVALTAGGNVTVTGPVTFYDFSRVGNNLSTETLTLTSNITVTNNLRLSGFSAGRRLFVTSNILSTPRTIINTGATMMWSNVDFKNISLSTPYDASAITGGSGDAGGNSSITFSPAQTNYWVTGTGGWDDTTKWKLADHTTAGRVPLPQDDVRFDASSFTGASQTVTANLPRLGKNIDWTGVTNTPTWAKTAASTIYGSVTLVSGMVNTGTTAITMEGREPFTFTSAGQTFTNPLTVAMIGGTLTLQDNFNSSATTTLSNGTLNAGTSDVTVPALNISGTNTRTLTMGSGTWTATSSGTVWDATTVTNLTLNPDTSTIAISNTGTAPKTFIGGGLTYNNITFSGDNIIVTGNNTFNTFAVNNAGLSTGLKLTSGSIQTITALSTNGYASNLAKLLSVTGGSPATLSKSSETVSVDYMSIKDSTASGGATWYAGANSTNVSGNTGWLFTSPDTTPSLLQTTFESITATSVTASSTITTVGGANATIRGFAYGTDSTFATVIATTSETGNFNIGPFSAGLSSLSCNTTYYVRAYAVNSYGTSTASSANFITSPCVPSIPTSVSAVSALHNTATITFTPGSDGGSSILYYLASSTPGNITATSTGSPITVTGLTNGVAYTFQVYAVNAVGTSTPSIASNAVTPNTNDWGLAGHWTFDTANTNWSASTTADSSGNSNTGILTNFYSSTSTVAGFDNQALYLNGGTEYVDAGNTASLSPTTGITISAWVKPVGMGASSYLTVAEKTNSYSLSFRQDGIVAMYLGGVKNWITSDSNYKDLFDGVWHHIVVTYDRSLQSLYIDNLLVATTTASGNISTNSNVMKIGTGYKGRLDDVRVYSSGLTESQIETLYLSYGQTHSPRTYYISSSNGNDDNDGLSEATPWQNIDKIYKEQSIPSKIIPGDSILLKRGDTWEGQIKIDRLGESGGQAITIGAYGTGAKPLIYGDGRNLVWTAVSGYPGVYEAFVGAGSDLQAVYEDNTAYTEDQTPLDLVASSWGQPYGRKDIIWIYTSDGNAPSNIRVFRNPTIKLSNSNNVVVENLDLRETWTAIYVNSSDLVNVKNIDTINTQDVSVYFGVDTNSIMDNITATSSGNTVLYIFVGSNNVIRNSTIGGVYDTISGISTPGSDNAGIGLQQSKYNLINSGALDYFYELGSIVRYNNFQNTNGFYPHGSGNIIYGNMVNGNGIHTAFNSGGVPSDYLNFNTYGNDGGPRPTYIFNNTFYNIGSYAMMASYGANGVVIRNNLVYGNAGVGLAWFTDSGGTVDSNYNCFYTSAPYTDSPHFLVDGVLKQSFAAFQSTGHDPHSVYGEPQLDANYRIASTSPCRNIGADISSYLSTQYTDYYGNPIYGTPDIGAVEYQPPFTLGTSLVDATGDILIYGDRKYEYTTATSSTMSADFNVTPAEGSWTYSASSTRPEWLNVSISTWNTSGTYSKAWTASSTNATTTIYIIGDMSPNAYYDIAVDGTSTTTLQANGSGRITYTYSGGYSTHTFTVDPGTNPTPTSNNSSTISSSGSRVWWWPFSSNTPVQPTPTQVVVNPPINTPVANNTNKIVDPTTPNLSQPSIITPETTKQPQPSLISRLLKHFTLSSFSKEDKKVLPTEVVFAKPANLPSYDVTEQAPSIVSSGSGQGTIHVLQGKSLDLAVKADKPVKEVTGYLTVKKIDRETALNDINKQKNANNLAGVGATIEDKLVLNTFKYTDPDNDGIYTATITAPKVHGEYDIMTILEYKDTKLGYRELHMTAVVDPEGYVYRMMKGLKARIPEANVTILKKNNKGVFVIWEANEYKQINPQITDDTGQYSFLVPEGSYKLTVEAEGYKSYEGNEFIVEQGMGVHENIELKKKGFLSGIFEFFSRIF